MQVSLAASAAPHLQATHSAALLLQEPRFSRGQLVWPGAALVAGAAAAALLHCLESKGGGGQAGAG